MRRSLRRCPPLVLCLALCPLPWVGGCVTPYDPAKLELQAPLPADTERRVLDVLNHQGYRLGQIQRDPLRVRTQWSNYQRGDVPGWKRAAVFLAEPATLNVLVEVRYLNLGMFGTPYETEVSGDRNLEAVLIDALRDAFE